MGNLCVGSAKLAHAPSPSDSNQASFHIKSVLPKSSKKGSTNLPASFPTFKKIDALPAASLKSFSLNDLKSASRNFVSTSFLGEGGFGCVFKGWIDENTFAPTKLGLGIVIAIKKLK